MERLNFEALKDLHNTANDLLHMYSPIVQQAIVDHRQEKWVSEVSEASLRMLDVCGISKDVLLLVKQHLQDLQLTLRRVGESDIGDKVAAYNCYRKKLNKETVKCLNSLKGMKIKSIISETAPVDHNLTLVVDVLREVRVTTISIVESLLSLIAIPWLDRKSSKRSFASKFMRVSGQSLYDICDEMAVQSANKRLEAVEITIEYLEVELECMFRRLIQTRVGLLNVLTK
ncbi:uncharacterized protein LOC107419770 [Ziziphus jujuba]|uniref:Uncharacterized protein LOC107419770 n=2 Tax=Ziziphus jujuba TaxID=326968 RepID=A0A6P4A748_ZIZJJ|nr:uncharacterized protein LOC107419770 [Ziziphus jujuba]KAH7523429.1 hypothetical protein FEM48_Zijuj06G0010000 [Ziziphus jujuba var. spinosa]